MNVERVQASTNKKEREKKKEATYTVTYGEFLRYCRSLAGVETKSEFARKLGFVDNDHYIGSENDKEGKKPSLDLLERAARATGHEFTEAIQRFPGQRKYSEEHEWMHTQLQELLDKTDNPDYDAMVAFFTFAIERFHATYTRGGRLRKLRGRPRRLKSP